MSAARFDKAKKPYSRPANRPRRSDGEWLHDRAPNGAGSLGPRAKADATTTATEPNSKLLVSNLHYEITSSDLTQIFGKMGTLVREPLIRYDRSGRSSGVAIVSYETAAEAKKALAQFDGKLCKGQPMSVTFDSGPPARLPRRTASAPSLINRIEKPGLLDRLGINDSTPAAATSTNGAGPIRNKRRGAARGAVQEPRKAKKGPKSAEELDMELDAFMKDEPKAAAPDGDVDMAA